MLKFLQSRSTWIWSCGFASFHVLTVVSVLIATGGSGEGQAFWVALADYPLYTALQHIPGGGYVLYTSKAGYIGFFCVAGTIMYGAFGLVVAFIARWFDGDATDAPDSSELSAETTRRV